MKRTLTSLWALTVASTKMYFRNRAAIFFTMFLPLAFIGVFGLLSKSSNAGSIKLNINDHANTPLSQAFVKAVKAVKVFNVSTDPQDQAIDKLGKNKLDLEVIVPGSFGTAGPGGLEPSRINALYNQSQPGSGQTAGLILDQIVGGFNNQVAHTPQILSVETQGVKTSNLGPIDFLLPGILAISIMQLGIFSVAFAFVSLKTTGALRRIQATPTHPANFVIAQGITRLIIGALQVFLLTGLGIWLFGFHPVGNFIEFLFVALLGVLLFLAFGFTVAGWAKDENAAAPIANLISFPMLFLSGTFFSRDEFPSWLHTITNYFPLTYLADALRRIANEGTPLTQLGPDLLGMFVWGAVMFFVAVRVFRWE